MLTTDSRQRGSRLLAPAGGEPFAGTPWLLAAGGGALGLSFVPHGIPLVSALVGRTGIVLGSFLLVLAVASWVWPSRARTARAWLRAFRRTRPFWGGVWLLAGGWLVLRLSMVSAHIVIVSGVTGVGGWLTGGGMILCGATAWAAPSQRYVVGVVGLLLAVASLVVSNLGGLFLGMLLGMLGGAMTLAWGPKRVRPPRGERTFRLGALALRPAPGPGRAP